MIGWKGQDVVGAITMSTIFGLNVFGLGGECDAGSHTRCGAPEMGTP